MKKSVLISFIALMLPFIAKTELTKRQLEQAGASIYHVQYVPDSILNCLEDDGHGELVGKIREANGFLLPETGYDLMPILVKSMENKRMQKFAEYRLALLSELAYSKMLFEYEEADAIAEKLYCNIEKNVDCDIEQLCWNLLVQNSQPNYSYSAEEARISYHVAEVYDILKLNPEIEPTLRLCLLADLEIAYAVQRLFLTSKELDSTIREMDKLFGELYPNLPHLKLMREPYHLLARIAENPESSMIHRMKLQRLIREGMLDAYNASTFLSLMETIAVQIGVVQEAESLRSEAQRRLKEIVDGQMRPTDVNTTYVSNLLNHVDYEQFGVVSSESDDNTERELFESLMAEFDSSVVGNRCRAMAMAPYAFFRMGNTVSLPNIDLARRYIESVSDDPYLPYRDEALCDGAVLLFNGGATNEAIDLLESTVAKPDISKRVKAIAYSSLGHCYGVKGDTVSIEMYEKAAEAFAQESRLDYHQMLSVYDIIVGYYTRAQNTTKAAYFADKLEEVRAHFHADKWFSYADWTIAYAKLLSAKNPEKELKKLYDKAWELGFTKQAFSLGCDLVTYAMASDDADAVTRYMERCYEIYSTDFTMVGNHEFASFYLNYLYSYRGDRATWRMALADIIDRVEANHVDLCFPFIQLLGSQATNALYSRNLMDANYCIALVSNKCEAIIRMLPPDDTFSLYNLAYGVVPIFVNYVQLMIDFWRTGNQSLTEEQREMILPQIELYQTQSLEWLENTIELQDKLTVSHDQVIHLAALHAQLLASMGNTEDAKNELNALEKWSEEHGVLDVFDSSVQGVRIDIALLSNDMDEWARLVDYERFWSTVEAGHGNIDQISINMVGLSGYFNANGNKKRAVEIAEKRFKLVRDFVDSQYMMLSETQRTTLVDNGTVSPKDIYRLLAEDSDNGLLSLAYDASLYYKNLLLESNNVLRRAVYSSKDSTQIADYERLLALQKQCDFTRMNLAEKDNRRTLRKMRALEDSISIRAYLSGALTLSRKTVTRDVARALASDEAAIEFTGGDDAFGALVLRKGDKAPHFVPLISYAELAECMEPLNTSGSRIAPKIKRIYSGTSQRGEKLYTKLWLPLEDYLAGVNRIYYSPIGNLSIVAFGAIQDSTLTSLSERYDMRLVSTTAAIVAKSKKKKSKSWSAWAIGDVAYEASPDMPKRNWSPLANSLAEVEHFDSICGSVGIRPQILLEDEASETALRALSGNSPSIMLLSTHGFYHNAMRAATEPFYINKGLTTDTDSVQPNYGIMPLKRGGLVLAHANKVWNNDGVVVDDVDGILTAEEISQLDLSNTELMVLSACETGLGETSITEGVNGLQRGLKLAGVKSMILSLWEVNDKAGREFMAEFYTHLFAGVNRHEAFRRATLTMKQRYPTEPANWAMFVMLD